MRRMEQGGFTLVELMIVVAIIGLLAMIGYPSYEEYIRRANRTEAKNLMMRIAGEQEKFFSTFNRYSGSINGARTGDPATSGLNMPDTTQDIRGGHQRKGPPMAGLFVARCGSRGRTRTADPVINSHLLYRLSYSGRECRENPQ